MKNQERVQETYTWEELYDRADNCGYGSDELTAKDNARWNIECFASDVDNYKIEDAECPEDEIFAYAEMYDFRFDKDGNLLSLNDTIGEGSLDNPKYKNETQRKKQQMER